MQGKANLLDRQDTQRYEEEIDIGLTVVLHRSDFCSSLSLPLCKLLYFFRLIGKGFPNVEDLENWHGKALGAQAAPAVEACQKLIVNPGPHGLSPLKVIDDAPHFTLPEVKLNAPPNYKLGDKVGYQG